MSEQPGMLQRVVMATVDGAWRYALLVIVLGLAIAGGSLYYAIVNFDMNTDRKAMLAEDLPFRQAFQRYQQAFPGLPDNLVVVIDAESPSVARDLARRLADQISEQPDLFVSVDLGRAEPFFEQQAWLYMPEEQASAVVGQVTQAAPSLVWVSENPTPGGLFELVYQRMRYGRDDPGQREGLEPLFMGLVDGLRTALGGDGAQVSWSSLVASPELAEAAQQADSGPGRAVVQIEPRLDYGKLIAAKPALQRVRELGVELGITESADRRLRITGSLAMAQEELRTVAEGMEIISALVFLAVTIILLLALRSIRMVLAVAISLLAGLMVTGGWAIFAVGHLNMVSVVFGVLYLGLGVDYAIHLGMRYRELLAVCADKRQAMVEAAGDVGGSLVVCAITTAIGFFAFIPTAYTGVSELGMISGAGMLISLVVSITLLPALLRWLSPAAGAVNAPHVEDRIQQAVTGVVVKGRWVVLVVVAFGAGLALPLVQQARFDANVLNLRDPNSESVATFEDLLRTSQVPPWYITVVADNYEDALSREAILEALPEVQTALHLPDFLPRGQSERIQQRDDVRGLIEPAVEGWGQKPPPTLDEQEEAARDLHWLLTKAISRGNDARPLQELHAALAEVIERSAEADQDQRSAFWYHLEQTLFADYSGTLGRVEDLVDVESVTVNDFPPAVRARWIGTGGEHRLLVTPAEAVADDWAAMERFVAAVTAKDTTATGAPPQMVASGAAIVEAFQQAMLWAFIAALVVLVLLLRRLLDVMLVLGPLVLAGLVTIAWMVWYGLPFNFANVIALPLLLGIGVDNGIHMVHRARHHQHDGRHALGTSTARAVLFSSLTTACSFGNLALSQHPGTASMGLLLFVGILASVVTTLVILPALLAACGLGRALKDQV